LKTEKKNPFRRESFFPEKFEDAFRSVERLRKSRKELRPLKNQRVVETPYAHSFQSFRREISEKKCEKDPAM